MGPKIEREKISEDNRKPQYDRQLLFLLRHKLSLKGHIYSKSKLSDHLPTSWHNERDTLLVPRDEALFICCAFLIQNIQAGYNIEANAYPNVLQGKGAEDCNTKDH